MKPGATPRAEVTERDDAADIGRCDEAHTDFIWVERGGHVAPRPFGGDPTQGGPRVNTTPRTQLGSIVLLLADASLSALSERVHRGSLANARRALDESRAAELAAQTEWQAVLSELSPLAPVHRLAASG